MNFVIPDFAPAIPEIVLLTLTSLLLVADSIWEKRYQFATYYVTQAILVIVGALILMSFASEQTITFNGSFVRDNFGDILKLFVVASP